MDSLHKDDATRHFQINLRDCFILFGYHSVHPLFTSRRQPTLLRVLARFRIILNKKHGCDLKALTCFKV